MNLIGTGGLVSGVGAFSVPELDGVEKHGLFLGLLLLVLVFLDPVLLLVFFGLDLAAEQFELLFGFGFGLERKGSGLGDLFMVFELDGAVIKLILDAFSDIVIVINLKIYSSNRHWSTLLNQQFVRCILLRSLAVGVPQLAFSIVKVG